MNIRDKQLLDTLTSFAYTAQVPLTLRDENMHILWECLSDRKFCSIFPSCDLCRKDCMQNLRTARNATLNVSDPFVFQCAAGLVGIAYPFMLDTLTHNTLFVGPLMMGLSRENSIRKLTRKIPAFQDYVIEIIDFISSNTIRTPQEISYLCNVLSDCLFSYKLEDRDFQIIDELFTTSAETVTSKRMSDFAEDQYKSILLQAIVSGDEKTITAHFRIFYEKTYLMNLGNQSRIRSHLLELFGYLSECITSDIFHSSYWLDSLESLKKAILRNELYQIALQMLLRLTHSNNPTDYTGASEIVHNAVDYLHENYSTDITLSSLARKINVNASYLSSLLKRETGLTFSQYLTRIRLNHSLELLSNTHLSITEISMSCGFSNQSYFIKTFKDQYHKTPGTYRKEIARHNQSDDSLSLP